MVLSSSMLLVLDNVVLLHYDVKCPEIIVMTLKQMVCCGVELDYILLSSVSIFCLFHVCE